MSLDNKLCKELGKLVETLTHTGQKTLDKHLLKKLKTICKKCDGYIDHVYHLLIYQLQKAHAEIRFSAFQICDELFRRSHCFRELLVSNLQHIIELTCETSDQTLPPPRSVALNLKHLALQTVQDWNKKYGDGYKKLQLGYKFLKHCKKVDFNAMQLETSAEQTRRQEQERRIAIVYEEKLRRTTTEIKDMLPEISSTLTSLESCIALLLPTPENFFIREECDITKDNKQNLTFRNDWKQFDEGNLIQNKSEDSLVLINDYSEIHDLDINPSENYKKIENFKFNSEATDSLDLDDESFSSEIQVLDVKPSTSKTIENSEFENSKFDSETDSSDAEDESLNFREFGIINAAYSMEVNVNTGPPVIKETAENAAIFENAKDLFTLINNRYVPTVKKWIQVLTKSSGNSEDLKRIIHMKHMLEKAIQSYQQLKNYSIPDYESSSSNSDFEEVEEKEGFEKEAYEDFSLLKTSIPKDSLKTQRVKSNWNIWSEENDEKDPTSAQSTLSILKSTKGTSNEQEFQIVTDPKPSTSKEDTSFKLEENRKAKLLAVAPKVPFDIDLYHWEDDKVKAPTMVAVKAEGSRFWHSTQEELEEVPVPEGVTSIRTRVIEFSGKFEPVRWSCRAPLPSGKLCPRHDRHKCPFHGPIVPRDGSGKCSNPEDADRITKFEDYKNSENPNWQDPQLLKDIKEVTGIDLKMPEKNKRGRRHENKKMFPGLTDINARKNTTYTRLSKKIFKRGAMRKIAKTMDAMDHRRFRDKFGDQFHYMHNTV